MSNIAVENVTVVTGGRIIPNTGVIIADSVIHAIGTGISADCEIVDGEGGYLIPGMIDMHVHGANGFDLMDGTQASVASVSVALAQTGCTGFLATSVTSSMQDLQAFIHSVRAVGGKEPGARILGIHLEGPYLNVRKKGMQNAAHLRNPDMEEMRCILELGQGSIKMVTLAPELPGGMEMIAFLKEHGVVTAIAHSDSTYEQAKHAFALGATHVTHCFNAIRPIHHREPGPIVAAWETKHVTCEAIADNVHLHPAIIRLMHRILGCERMTLATDAMQALGMEDGTYHFGGHEVTVKDRVARLSDGTLASSTLSMGRALETAVEDGIDLADAVEMACATPARILGLTTRGTIQPGANASLTLLTSDLKVRWVMVDGRLIPAAAPPDSCR